MVLECCASQVLDQPVLSGDHRWKEWRFARVEVELAIASGVLDLVDRLPLPVMLEPVDRKRIPLDELPNGAPPASIVGAHERAAAIPRTRRNGPAEARRQRRDDDHGVDCAAHGGADLKRVVVVHCANLSFFAVPAIGARCRTPLFRASHPFADREGVRRSNVHCRDELSQKTG